MSLPILPGCRLACPDSTAISCHLSSSQWCSQASTVARSLRRPECPVGSWEAPQGALVLH